MEYESPYRTFTVSAGGAADIPQYSRVAIDSSGELILAPAADQAIGTVRRVGVLGEPVAVNMWNRTRTVIATGAITLGDNVVPEAATGKYDTSVGATPWVALEAATADGDVIEIAPVD